MRRLAVVVFFALACGAIAAHAQSLTFAYHLGDAYKYKVHSKANETINSGTGAAAFAIAIGLDMTAQETITVQSVDAAGTADLLIAITNPTIKETFNGVTSTTTINTFPTVDVKIGADGRILSGNGSLLGGGNLSPVAGLGGRYMSVVLPNAAVKLGDTWSKDYNQPNPNGSGSIHVTTKSKYLRDETVQGINAAVVETTIATSIEMTLDMSNLTGASSSSLPGAALNRMTVTGKSTSKVTAWIDPGAHRVLKSHTTGSSEATMTMHSTSGSTMAGLTGPVSLKGTETMDLSPA